MREQAFALQLVASNLGDLRRYEEALATAREAAAMAEQAGEMRGQMAAFLTAASNLGNLRRHKDALATAREAAALAERAGEVGDQAICLSRVARYLRRLRREDEAIANIHEAIALAERARDLGAQCIVAYGALSFRALIGLDLAIASYDVMIESTEQGDREDAALWFDDIAHVVTLEAGWPRLIAAVERSFKAVEQIVAGSAGLGEAGQVIVTTHRANKSESALAQARHVVAALAHAIETAPNPEAARLWVAVLNASAEQIAIRIEDVVFLRNLADILTAYSSVPERPKDLLAAAAAFHANGRDPAALARLEPDLATTLMAVFKPKPGSVKRKRKRKPR